MLTSVCQLEWRQADNPQAREWGVPLGGLFTGAILLAAKGHPQQALDTARSIMQEEYGGQNGAEFRVIQSTVYQHT